MITLIVARARCGAIGRDGGIPWHAPEDLRMFKRETLGGALVMGRRTWQSLPVRPLANRLNTVVSRDAAVAEHVFADVDAALAVCSAAGYQRIYGIGGTAIYAALLPRAHRLLITEVDTEVPGASAFFPPFDAADWHEVARRPLPAARDTPAMELRELLCRAPDQRG